MGLDRSDEKVNIEITCGFEKEINDLIENQSFLLDEWKAAYKSMDPSEIIHFLNDLTEELCSLKSESSPDPLSKEIISNVLFKELIKKYPGTLISNHLKEKLIEKMDEKFNPIKKLRIKIDKLVETKQYDEIKSEISKFFESYENFIGDKEYLETDINGFLYNILEDYQYKEIEYEIIKYIATSYLNFLKNKNNDSNQALFFIKLGSYFNDKNELPMARDCLLKAKAIYKNLEFEKDLAKVDKILDKLLKKKPKKKKKRKT